jgi:methyl-accepting chemotaxis protein
LLFNPLKFNKYYHIYEYNHGVILFVVLSTSDKFLGGNRSMIDLKDMKIGAKLTVGFGVVIILLILMGIMAALSLTSTSKAVTDLSTVRIPQKDSLAVITKGILSTAWHMRDAMIANGRQDINRHLALMQANPQKVTDAYEQLKTSLITEEGRKLYEIVLEKRKAYNEVRGPLVELLKAGKQKEAIAMKEKLNPVLVAYVNAVAELDAAINAHVAKKSKEAADDINNTFMIIIALAIAALVMAAIVTVVIIRSITVPISYAVDAARRISGGDLTVRVESAGKGETGQLLVAMGEMADRIKGVLGDVKQVSANVASDSGRLSASSKEITRTMNDQSNRSAQIATAVEEMSQTVIDIAKNASTMSQKSADTAAKARKGADVVRKSVTESRSIVEAVNASTNVVQSLGEKSKQIGEIVDVINDIADQTNLLALNAAIEAARAGEQGRGFAVVADEVRKLAERTAKATTEISQMIGAIQGEVTSAVDAMGNTNEKVNVGLKYSLEAGEELKHIVVSAVALQKLVDQIAAATEEMTTTSESVNGDIQAVAGGAKDISGGATMIAEASAELAKLAGQLKTIVDKFSV